MKSWPTKIACRNSTSIRNSVFALKIPRYETEKNEILCSFIKKMDGICFFSPGGRRAKRATGRCAPDWYPAGCCRRSASPTSARTRPTTMKTPTTVSRHGSSSSEILFKRDSVFCVCVCVCVKSAITSWSCRSRQIASLLERDVFTKTY